VAKNVRKNSEKMSAVCPHCAFSQEESVHAKSTFCRKCGEHYNVERPLAGEQSIVKEPSIFQRLARMVSGEKEREICCFSCGHKQIVSTAAQSSMCPSCGAYVDLRDFKIAGPFGRSVQTAGLVQISAKGDVTSTKIMCGSAMIEGSLRGYIVCTGTATVKVKGRLPGGLEAEHILVDKKGQVEFVRMMKARLFEVNGKATARVMADKVVINKGGILEGTVYARAITVEKGGIFSGELIIGAEDFAVADDPPPADDPNIARFDEDDLSFGQQHD
jgi:cytoskeletal protein CcmA (bactofilin family)